MILSGVPITCFLHFGKFWFYEHFTTAAPVPRARLFPAVRRWTILADESSELSPLNRFLDLNMFRDFLASQCPNLISYSPWQLDDWKGSGISDSAFARAADMAACRMLFRGPFGYVWYLGERVTRQHDLSLFVPEDPPSNMFTLHRPLVPDILHGLHILHTHHGGLVLEDADYPSFRSTRLAPLVQSCPIKVRATLPHARVRVVGSNGVESFEDLPLVTDEVHGLPLPVACHGLDRSDTEHVFRVVEALKRKVMELSNMLHVSQRMPAPAGFNGGTSASFDIPTYIKSGDLRASEIYRALSMNVPSRNRRSSMTAPSGRATELEASNARKSRTSRPRKRKLAYVVEERPEEWLEDENNEEL